ncbi:MAG: 2-succinyl-5-enolpyruvyl-6-hydroxy-3-cyclohexene-1-carboxylic-acid synthase [Bacteroidaceae bacterium]|nr:2-succinyl-5-enolpyruvyl-6-hydroxy-3-cyclohexene-1-carboxylic-acid synthase [Bacteroidaceae bacterium]
MISDNRSIQELAALLLAHGVKDVVLCPGSRNAALTHTLSQTAQFRCHALTDERSAGFYALGLSLSTGRPAAVCVTSGSALLNLHPAVSEAYYQQVPLVVVSADRPQAWVGQMDGQTLPQPGVFGSLVRCSVQLPEIHTDEERWYANRLINEALLSATQGGGGPVHINVPIPEPFYEFHTECLPMVRVIRRQTLPELLKQAWWLRREKCLIAVGQHPTALHFPQGCAVLSEHIGNQQEGIRGNLDALIANIPGDASEDFRPHLLITIGGHIVSKRFKQFLRNHPPQHHVHISPRGEVTDTFQCLTDIVTCTGEDFCLATQLQVPQPQAEEARAYTQMWEQLAEDVRMKEGKKPLTEEESAVRLLLSRLPKHAVLHLANSSAVRLAEKFPVREEVLVQCNRGVNGIEGSLSTAVGYATAQPDRQHFAVIGDLSFFYDQNALWNTRLPQNLHILLLNNGGGKIFETLPIPDEPRSRDFICGHHHASAEAACRQYGLRYLNGQEKIAEFVASEQCTLLEIKTI